MGGLVEVWFAGYMGFLSLRHVMIREVLIKPPFPDSVYVIDRR